jgi:hypothetical protein
VHSASCQQNLECQHQHLLLPVRSARVVTVPQTVALSGPEGRSQGLSWVEAGGAFPTCH